MRMIFVFLLVAPFAFASETIIHGGIFQALKHNNDANVVLLETIGSAIQKFNDQQDPADKIFVSRQAKLAGFRFDSAKVSDKQTRSYFSQTYKTDNEAICWLKIAFTVPKQDTPFTKKSLDPVAAVECHP
jgi:hypothetical protein